MYLFDRAAWLTSDDLVSRLPKDRHAEIGGWVVTPTGGGVHVDYFGQDAASDRVVYSADVIQGVVRNPAVHRAAKAPTLSGPTLQMARAKQIAAAEMAGRKDWQPCANVRFNTVVLPPDKDGTVPVYFLTPQTKAGAYPFGGHYRIDISRHGKVTDSRTFTKSCLTLGKPPTSSGNRTAALVVTHNLDAQPTEIHVFQQLHVGVPLLVATGRKTIWRVERGQINDFSAMLTR